MCVIGLDIVFIYSSLLRTSADAGMNIRRECCAIVVSQMTSERTLKPSRVILRITARPRRSVVRVKVIVKVIDLQTSRQRDLSYMALT